MKFLKLLDLDIKHHQVELVIRASLLVGNARTYSKGVHIN